MTKTTVSYEELAKRVDVMVMANHLPNEVDEDWYSGIIQQPLMDLRLEELDKENELTDEQREQGEGASVTDFEIYQTYIITQNGAEYLFNHTAELISYSEKLGLWFWHIGHWGTSWSGVHTDIVDDIDYDSAVYGTENMVQYSIG
jgi:hypothetical protein